MFRSCCPSNFHWEEHHTVCPFQNEQWNEIMEFNNVKKIAGENNLCLLFHVFLTASYFKKVWHLHQFLTCKRTFFLPKSWYRFQVWIHPCILTLWDWCPCLWGKRVVNSVFSIYRFAELWWNISHLQNYFKIHV